MSNKVNNKETIEKAIDKLPYSLGNKATEMLKAYVDDDKEKYVALASQFDKENAETAQEVRRLQYGLQCSQEFAALLIPYVQPWLADKQLAQQLQPASSDQKSDNKKSHKAK